MYATQVMGYRVCMLDLGPNSSAGIIAERYLCADYTDEVASAEMAALCPAITAEFENVPTQALGHPEQLGVLMAPRTNCVSIAQGRITEKKLFALCAARTDVRPVPSWVTGHEVDIG